LVQVGACALERRGPRQAGITEYALPPTPYGATENQDSRSFRWKANFHVLENRFLGKLDCLGLGFLVCYKRAESPRLAIMRITVVCSIEGEILWHSFWGSQREGLRVLGRIREPIIQVNTRSVSTQSFGSWLINNAQRLLKMESKFH